MSLVIAIKDKERIVLGADKQMSVGYNKDHTCTKIWEVEELPGTIMGGVGSARANQIIQYAQIIDKNDVKPESFDTGYVITHIVPTIVATLKANGIDCSIKENDDTLMIPNVFILAYRDKAWMIWNDLSVTELVEYLAIGSGSDVATGALFATKNKNPFERIVTCIDAAADSTLFVDNGVDLLATGGYKSDEAMIKKALTGPLPDFDEVMEVLANADKKAKAKTTKKKTPAKKVKKPAKEPVADKAE